MFCFDLHPNLGTQRFTWQRKKRKKKKDFYRIATKAVEMQLDQARDSREKKEEEKEKNNFFISHLSRKAKAKKFPDQGREKEKEKFSFLVFFSRKLAYVWLRWVFLVHFIPVQKEQKQKI